MRLIKTLWELFKKNILVWIFMGVWLLVMMFIHFNTEWAKNTAATKLITENSNTIIKQLDLNNPNSNLSKLKASDNSDHDTIINYAQCIINLFGSHPGQVITKDDTDKCLAGTRIVPAPSQVPSAPPKSTSSTNSLSTNQNTTSNQNQQPEKPQSPQSPPGLTDNLFKVPRSYPLNLILSKAREIRL